MTIQEFAKKYDNNTQAAAAVGVHWMTFNRWVLNKAKPQGLAVKRLRELGVEIRK